MAQRCVTDFDCADNEMCYSGVQWFEDGNYAGDGCLCNTWYAWTGENCDQYSRTTVFLIFWNLITIAIGLGTCIVLVKCAIIYRRTRKSFCRYSVTTACIVFSFLAALNASLWALVQLVSTATVTGPPLVDYEDARDIYKGRANFLSNFVGPLAAFFAALALLQISLMWVDLSVRSGQLSVEKRTQLVHTRRLVYVFQFLCVLLGSVGAAVEKSLLQNVMGFFILPLVLAVIATYIGGAIAITRLLNAKAADQARFYRDSKDLTVSLPDDEGHGSGGVVGSPPADALSGRAAAEALRPEALRPEPLGATMKRGAKKALSAVRSFNIGSGRSQQSLDSTEEQSEKSVDPKRIKERRRFEDILRRIRNTAIAVSFCLALFQCMYLGLSITDAIWDKGWKELAPPNQFFTIKSVHNLLMSSIVLSQVIVAWYVLRSLRNSEKTSRIAAKRK